MLRFLGEVYARSFFGREVGAIFGVVVGVVYGVLLLSAVNTAILATVGVVFMPRELEAVPVRERAARS